VHNRSSGIGGLTFLIPFEDQKRVESPKLLMGMTPESAEGTGVVA